MLYQLSDKRALRSGDGSEGIVKSMTREGTEGGTWSVGEQSNERRER